LLLGSFLKIAEIVHIFGLLISTVKVTYFFQKCIGLRFGRYFSQTHQVTLPLSHMIACVHVSWKKTWIDKPAYMCSSRRKNAYVDLLDFGMHKKGLPARKTLMIFFFRKIINVHITKVKLGKILTSLLIFLDVLNFNFKDHFITTYQ
jgi:hypothetical protein